MHDVASIRPDTVDCLVELVIVAVVAIVDAIHSVDCEAIDFQWETPTASLWSLPMKVRVMKKGRAGGWIVRSWLTGMRSNSEPQPFPTPAGGGERCVRESTHRGAQGQRLDLCVEVHSQR